MLVKRRLHSPGEPDRLARCLAAWLVPAAQTKSVEGPWRTARWLGDGLLAVTGSDASLTRGANGKEREIYRAAGLRFVDTHSWSARTVDQGASDVVTAGELVLASGGSYDSATMADRSQGIAIVAYGHDGRERWRLHPGENRWLQPAAGFGYVYLDGTHVEIVDLATGTVVRALRRQGNAWPVLLLGNSID